MKILSEKLTNAMTKLANLKNHYIKNFINNNEISRKIYMIDDHYFNYNFLQEFYNFTIQKVNKFYCILIINIFNVNNYRII
jgi:hypothetical protein